MVIRNAWYHCGSLLSIPTEKEAAEAYISKVTNSDNSKVLYLQAELAIDKIAGIATAARLHIIRAEILSGGLGATVALTIVIVTLIVAGAAVAITFMMTQAGSISKGMGVSPIENAVYQLGNTGVFLILGIVAVCGVVAVYLIMTKTKISEKIKTVLR